MVYLIWLPLSNKIHLKALQQHSDFKMGLCLTHLDLHLDLCHKQFSDMCSKELGISDLHVPGRVVWKGHVHSPVRKVGLDQLGGQDAVRII